MSVLSTDGSACHPVTPVNWCLVVVDHDAATHNRCFPTERQVGVGEEGLGAREVSDTAGHSKVGVLVLQVSNLAACLSFFSGTKVDPGRRESYQVGALLKFQDGLTTGEEDGEDEGYKVEPAEKD